MQEINILIIEDKKKDLVFLEKFFKELGYNSVLSVSCGADGVTLAKEVNFAVIISELHMPKMNGIDITKAIMRVSPRTSVVVMTTYMFIKNAVEAMEEGAYGYVTKPYNTSEIRIVVERAIERFMLLSSDKKKEHFAELSIKDGLTGMYNRRFLNKYIDNKISLLEGGVEEFSIIMIDIDHFKKFNDTKGHLAGDRLLRKMCEIFQEAIRQEDVIFRYGGEEFLIYIAATGKHGARLVAERIRSVVELYMPTTVSLGVGTYPEDGHDLNALIASSDTALYKAKETGRNKVCLA